MNLFSKRDIKNLFKKHQFRPLKRLGQNFLVDKGAIKKVIEAVNLSSEDIVLEIGPGLGVLTQELAKGAKRVIAIEKDPKMIEILKETMKGFDNVDFIQGDILKLKFQITNSKLQTNSKIQIPKNYKIVGSLPFYLATPIIRQFLELVEARLQPFEMVLVVQKEVGQRICAKPPRMSILAVSVQIYAKPEIISYISKKSFWPQPKVDSAIIRIAPLINADRKLINTDLFFRIVKAGFSQPRKQLINNLSKSLSIDRKKVEKWLLKNNIQPTQRAETLEVEDWLNLSKTLK